MQRYCHSWYWMWNSSAEASVFYLDIKQSLPWHHYVSFLSVGGLVWRDDSVIGSLK